MPSRLVHSATGARRAPLPTRTPRNRALRRGCRSAKLSLLPSYSKRRWRRFPLYRGTSRMLLPPRFSPSSKMKPPGRSGLLLPGTTFAALPMKPSKSTAKVKRAPWTISFDRIPHHSALSRSLRQPTRRSPQAGSASLPTLPRKSSLPQPKVQESRRGKQYVVRARGPSLSRAGGHGGLDGHLVLDRFARGLRPARLDRLRPPSFA